jgi:hypothetical protein
MNLIVSLREKIYNERLEAIKLKTLETRPTIEDITEVFKGFDYIDLGRFF